jgi:hypothetical protein
MLRETEEMIEEMIEEMKTEEGMTTGGEMTRGTEIETVRDIGRGGIETERDRTGEMKETKRNLMAAERSITITDKPEEPRDKEQRGFSAEDKVGGGVKH